ncbi:MAG: DUF4352 domain-containing protein [Myxococcota bacterium]
MGIPKLLAVLVLAVGISLACAGAPPSQSGGSATSATKDQRANLGEPFSLGDYSYQIDKASKSRVVGTNQFARKTAPTGATWVVVEYRLRNDGKKSEVSFGSQLKLIDPSGREFDTSSEGSTAVMMSGGPDTLSSEHPPGIWQNSAAVFLIPDDAWAPGLDLVVPAGVWKSGRVLVSLVSE